MPAAWTIFSLVDQLVVVVVVVDSSNPTLTPIGDSLITGIYRDSKTRMFFVLAYNRAKIAKQFKPLYKT